MRYVLGGALAVILLVGLAWCGRAAWRLRVRRGTARQREELVAEFGLLARNDDAVLAKRFQRDQLITVNHFLAAAPLTRLRQEADANRPRIVRSFVPTHKQGGTVSYDNIHAHAPGCLALYHSSVMHRWISEIVGAEVKPAADHDQSACSILYYTQPGDYINWHRDPNFYRGRQFTILLVLANEGAGGGTSSSALLRKHTDGREERIDLAENGLVLFEGPRVLHKVSPTSVGDTRIALSMTFNTDPRISLFWELVRRVKDTAFYGWKVLWD